jgi:hypothetical protein
MKAYEINRSYRILLFILFLLILVVANSLFVRSQPMAADSKPSKYIYPKIMIIPYNPANYKSDMDMSGVIFEDDSPFGEYYSANRLIRYNIERTLSEDLLLYFDIRRVLFYDKLSSMQKDLDYIYRSVNYDVQTQRLNAYYRNFPEFSIMQILGSEEKRWGVNCVDQTSQKPILKNPRITYFDVTVKDTHMFPYLTERYHCDYYLFINGFELKTRFKICMDLMKNVKQKDIILHFTLFDSKGNREVGGLVGITYEPHESDIFEIAENNLGILSSLVTDVIKNQLGLTMRYDVEE